MQFSRLTIPKYIRNDRGLRTLAGGAKPSLDESASSNISDEDIRTRVAAINLDTEAGFHDLVGFVNHLRSVREIKRYPVEPPRDKYTDSSQNKYTDDYSNWFANYQMWMRGMIDWKDRETGHYNTLHDKIREALNKWGLHVSLNIDDLPGTNQELLSGKNEEFWGSPQFNLFKIKVEPGENWLTFLASTFQDKGHVDNDFHISLCYMWELNTWYDLLKSRLDTNKANEQVVLWFNSYRQLRDKYNNKEAYVAGRVTGGHTVNLSPQTRVIGHESEYDQLYDGGQPDQYGTGYQHNGDALTRFVHRFSGYEYDMNNPPKCQQDLHVSLLMDDDYDEAATPSAPSSSSS
jgi:hypothetical protein